MTTFRRVALSFGSRWVFDGVGWGPCTVSSRPDSFSRISTLC